MLHDLTRRATEIWCSAEAIRHNRWPAGKSHSHASMRVGGQRDTRQVQTSMLTSIGTRMPDGAVVTACIVSWKPAAAPVLRFRPPERPPAHRRPPQNMDGLMACC